MLFFIVGICFVFYLKKKEKEKDTEKLLGELVCEWVMLSYAEKNYFIKPSKLFLVNKEFRLLTIDLASCMFDFAFLYPSFFINLLFSIFVLVILLLCAVFKMANDMIYFKNNTSKPYLIKFKLILLKIYFSLPFYLFFMHVFFNFAEDTNVIQELLIKFLFLLLQLNL